MFNIWVIDDDTELCEDIIDFWKKLSIDYPFDFRLFSTAKQALETLWSVPLTGKPAPDAIIVDGHLKKDQSDLNNGAAVICEIIAVAEDKGPILVAWSADPMAEEYMMSAGANASFGKTRPREVIRYLQKHYDKLPSRTNRSANRLAFGDWGSSQARQPHRGGEYIVESLFK